MDGQFPEILRLELRCDVRAPSLAREALSSVDEIACVRDEARLVASELVSNAVIHAECAPDDLIEVSARLGRDRLLISVHDPGVSDQTRQAGFADHPGCGGLGLRIVRQLARRWGADRPNGHLVWAELAV